MKKIRIRLIKSPISEKKVHKRTLRALGLRRIGAERTFNQTPQLLGMLKRVRHLIKWEEV
ncbi:50S ribosomal protein L30 [candidate division WOR-3 bacterium]|uniref:50S ribosomal protein L30 n=1 Tax=candidate division WOR-3 bacterium TaxID=2052148 RepID=A0A660SNG2_UNCW3|nr:MAG: 50S ribosomal protein L30 [candidate division WOR-3 bacterium]